MKTLRNTLLVLAMLVMGLIAFAPKILTDGPACIPHVNCPK